MAAKERIYKSLLNKNSLNGFVRYIHKNICDKSEVIFVCIGSMLLLGDSIAPRIGSELEKLDIPYRIYGNERNTVNAMNVEDVLEHIKQHHKNPYIIAIDASIGNPEHIGSVSVRNKPLRPGSAAGKKLPPVGDLSILCIMTEKYDDLYTESASLLYKRVEMFKKYITEGIKLAAA